MKTKIRKSLGLVFILLSLFIPMIVYTFFLIIKKEYDPDKVLTIFQCGLGIIAFFIPNILSKRLKLEIPPKMYYAYIIFLYCSITLGEVRSYYYKFFFWDDLLHLFSGMMLGSLGFSIVTLLNKNVKALNLSPIFITIFSISFAVSIGVLWEIYEYLFDGILGLNMQKFALNDGTNLIGHFAIKDTMSDLIIDYLGAIITGILGYLSIINKSEWFKDNMQIQKVE